MQTDSHNIRKRFSQNFLKDQNVIEKIVSIINPQKNDYIVEIGPGKGALTIPIFKSVSKLNVIEIDKDLVKLLRKNIKDESFIIHEDDAMKFNYLKFKNSELRLVGNLPYNISTPLLFHLLSYKDVIKNMYFMLQKEVVERICAKSGTKKYGRLSVMLQCYCDVESMLIIKPDAFYPSPKVESAIIKITPLSKPKYNLLNDKSFSLIVKEAFSQRRKTIRNSLKKFLNEIDIREIDIQPSARAENLSIKDFINLSNLYQKSLDN
jgi:16S rRNA (adenine1518-N6/adenine1519-N6)-dimethyltransferase|tara:strand:- start:301 stop:1092 length:792 start_codon:yes stop_codon:yes gene_type:complete